MTVSSPLVKKRCALRRVVWKKCRGIGWATMHQKRRPLRFLAEERKYCGLSESRLSDFDTIIRQRNIILSGNELPKEESGENCTEVVRKLIQTKLRTIVPSTDIDAAFRIGKPSTTGRSILVKFNKPE